ncbi:MAG: hypothetical protein EAZ32_07975 [Cytophagia bacterium]|nr:MAG: hypothetical protein EAZ46_08360 [Runella sp.]TAG17656.1 MAG: hypothetical protein EAZ38_16990 [Cytophagales bacterium]TAG40041.1 MAG: hypothetical protein EAZ32_07975 [Cytophagia bacterium]TAG78228.1 MAG: hypothetical protein EAZ22_14050 [Cytophagales bacterium]
MNLSNYKYTAEAADGDIRLILTHILDCHKLMIVENRKVKNDEDTIRYILTEDYLMNPKVRKKLGISLSGYLFQPEAPIINDTYKAVGWIDIKVFLPSQIEDDQKALYFIECKRLDGKSKLNKYYVEGGILRFIENKYQTFFGSNGMLAFCVAPFNVEANTLKINKYINNLCKENTEKVLAKNDFLDDEANTYLSQHWLAATPVEKFSLYHLMLDFSPMIEK